MNTTTKEVVEFFGGKYLLGGALIQFGEDSFNEMYKEIYDAAMLTERKACAKVVKDLFTPPDEIADFIVEKIMARGEA